MLFCQITISVMTLTTVLPMASLLIDVVLSMFFPLGDLATVATVCYFLEKKISGPGGGQGGHT